MLTNAGFARGPVAMPAARLCVQEQTLRTARATPDLVAIEADAERVTYAELDRRSAQVARGLGAHGVQPGDVVGIRLHSSVDAFVCILAVLRAGAVVLPLDPSYPAERLRLMQDDAQPACVVHAPEDGASGRSATAGELSRAGASSVAPLPPVGLDDVAYLVYTSGSTGRPKGIAMPHRGLSTVVARQAAVNGPARTLQFAPLSFDASLLDCFGAWAAGGTLVLLPPGERRDLVALAHRMRDAAIERTILPVVALEQLARICRAEEIVLPDLQAIVVGGAQLVVSDELRAWFGSMPWATLENHYGTSEIHTATAHALDGDPADWPHLPPIGRPFPGVEVGVLTAEGGLAAAGETGELFVGGDVVSRGYLNQPELTAERYPPHPLDERARIYRTGDLAMLDDNGEVWFLGRADDQVKIRGYRIELGEVEAVLRQHPAVDEAAAAALDAPGGGRQLAAAVVGSLGRDEAAGLRAWLGERVPDWMVPGRIELVPALPLTPSGKLDRRTVASALAQERHASERPADPLEARIAGMMADALGVDGVGRDDSFLAVGGDSVTGASVIARIRSELGAAVTVRALFAHPSPAGLAAAVAAAETLSGPELRRGGAGDGPPPLSFSQERLWFMHQLDPATPAYNLVEAFRVVGPLDVEALTAAVEGLVRRHAGLRCRFGEAHGKPVLHVDDAWGGSIDVRRADASGDPEEQANAFAASALNDPFDLARDPLLRVRLLELAPDDHLLAIGVHHIVSDDRSIAIMLDELGALYAAALHGRAAELAPLPLDPRDFARWQRQALAGAAADGHLAYWKEQLAGAPALLALTRGDDVGRVEPGRGRARAFTVPQELTSRLQGRADDAGATLFMVLLTSFGALLTAGAPRDVLVGVPSAGRVHADLAGLVGFFVNTLPIRARLSDDPEWAGALEATRDAVLGALAHEELPFERIVEAVRPKRVRGVNPLVQTTFQLLGERPALTLEGAEARRHEVPERVSRFDLSVDLFRAGGGLEGQLLWDDALLDDDAVAALADRYVRILEQVADDPRRRVSTLG